MNAQIRTRQFLISCIAAIILSVSCSLVLAEEDHSYEIQFLLFDTSTQGANYEPNALLYKHIVPYNRLISFEGIVALGINEESARRKIAIGTQYTQKLKLSNMLGFFAKLTGELEPSVHGYVHFGLTRVELDFSTPSSIAGADGSQSGTGLAYGVGLNFRLLEKGAFVLEFNVLPEVDAAGETFDSTYIALGYQIPF